MTGYVFAEGQLVRVANWRGVFRLRRIHLTRGEADVWGPINGARQGMRSVETTRLLPPRKTDYAAAGS